MKFALLLASCLCLTTPLSAIAQGVNEMPTAGFDEIAAKLIMAGYRDLRVVDLESGKMSGYSANGSEVIIFVDQKTRRITSTNRVHQADE